MFEYQVHFAEAALLCNKRAPRGKSVRLAGPCSPDFVAHKRVEKRSSGASGVGG